MTKKKTEGRIRKDFDHKNGRTQKMMSFRLDLDIVDWLGNVQNKGRLINELLRQAMTDTSSEPRREIDPDTTRTEDVEP